MRLNGRAVAVTAVVIVVLGLGVLIGRWLLPNNAPCSVDYGLLASTIIALGTVGLVIVGGFGIKYAYQTAQSAIDALNLKAAPFILAEVDNGEDPPNGFYSVRLNQNKLLLGPPDKESKSGARISVRNVGERAVFNVQVTVRIDDLNKQNESTTAMIFAQWLLPGQRTLYVIQNSVPTT